MPLTMYFLKRYSQELRKEVLGISKEAMGLLERYSWPGNVRELENVLERAVILCQGTVVTAQDAAFAARTSESPCPQRRCLPTAARRDCPGGSGEGLIQQALEQSHQNKSHAAKLLSLSRTQLRTRMRHYGLE